MPRDLVACGALTDAHVVAEQNPVDKTLDAVAEWSN